MSSTPPSVLAAVNPQINTLGQHCEENLNNPANDSGVALIPCPNRPNSGFTIRPCNFTRSHDHHAPNTHNVCEQCLNNQKAARDVRIKNHLNTVQINVCKACSNRQKRRNPPQANNCTCLQNINAGWKCRKCIDKLLEDPLVANSKDRLAKLYVTHRLKKNKPARGYRIEKDGKRRARPACRGAGARTVPCGRVASTAWDAVKICLACDGAILPPAERPRDP